MNNAKLYEHANSLQKRDAQNLLKEFAPRLQWNRVELILDIGCGSGDVTREILAPTIPLPVSKKRKSNKFDAGKDLKLVEAANIVGVDVSHEMIRHAKSKICTPQEASVPISFSHLDISKEIPNGKLMRKFSKIFSFYCLHWIKDQGVALHNIHQLLERNGEAFLVFLAKNPIFDAYRRMAQNSKWQSYMKDVEVFVPSHQDATDPATSLSMQLDALGFQIHHCESRNFSYLFENMNHLALALKAVNPFLSRIENEALKSDFMSELLSELSEYKTILGQYVARYSLMIVHVSKPSIVPQKLFKED